MLALELRGERFNKRFSGANLQAYRLYRLFNFRRGPKLFILPGDVRRHARLHAVNYRASF